MKETRTRCGRKRSHKVTIFCHNHLQVDCEKFKGNIISLSCTFRKEMNIFQQVFASVRQSQSETVRVDENCNQNVIQDIGKKSVAKGRIGTVVHYSPKKKTHSPSGRIASLRRMSKTKRPKSSDSYTKKITELEKILEQKEIELRKKENQLIQVQNNNFELTKKNRETEERTQQLKDEAITLARQYKQLKDEFEVRNVERNEYWEKRFVEVTNQLHGLSQNS